MRLSAEEKTMYEVMKTLYDSGIPVNFKGSMVLKACLMEAGFSDDTRHTVDIDGNWISDTLPSAEQMVYSFKRLLTIIMLRFLSVYIECMEREDLQGLS